MDDLAAALRRASHVGGDQAPCWCAVDWYDASWRGVARYATHDDDCTAARYALARYEARQRDQARVAVGGQIVRLHAILYRDPAARNGSVETLASYHHAGLGWTPMVAGNDDRLAELVATGRRLVKNMQQPLRVVTFHEREDGEWLAVEGGH